MTSFNGRRALTVVMPHQPTDVVLFPIDLPHHDLHITADAKPLQNLQHEAVLCSPVTRLPPEILAHIFELYVVGVGEWTPVSFPVQGPLCLLQVSKLWRTVAESDPHLWTSIYVCLSDLRQSIEADIPRVKLVFDLHLKRSGTLPISLTFVDERSHHPATTNDFVSLLMDQLRTHSRRWKRISLHLFSGYLPLVLTFTPCDLSSLEYLHIIGNITQRSTALCLNLDSATNLKSFTYSGPIYLKDRIDFHWEQLAEVSFEFEPRYEPRSMLSPQFRYLAQCQNITTCSLGIDRPFSIDLDGDQTITLPHLRTLRVRRLSLQSHARTTIDPLILPRLQTLEIDAAFFPDPDYYDPPWHDHNFSNLLARSGCTLLHLSIRTVDFPNDELVRCLARSHMLTSFCFIPCPRSQDIVDVIRRLDVSRSPREHGQGRVGDDGPLVPALREIKLMSSVEEYLDVMMVMFRSRAGPRARGAGVAALRLVEVVFFDELHVMPAHPGDGYESERVASFRRELERWVSENEKEKEKSEKGEGEGDEERLEASVVIEYNYEECMNSE